MILGNKKNDGVEEESEVEGRLICAPRNHSNYWSRTGEGDVHDNVIACGMQVRVENYHQFKNISSCFLGSSTSLSIQS